MDKNKEKMVFAIALQFGKGALDTINIFGGIDGQKQS